MSETEPNEPQDASTGQEPTAAHESAEPDAPTPEQPAPDAAAPEHDTPEHAAAEQPAAESATPPPYGGEPPYQPPVAHAGSSGPSRGTQVAVLVVTAGVAAAVGLTAGVVGAHLVSDDGHGDREDVTATQDGRGPQGQPPMRSDDGTTDEDGANDFGDRGGAPPDWSAGDQDDDQGTSGQGSSDQGSGQTAPSAPSGSHSQSGAS